MDRQSKAQIAIFVGRSLCFLVLFVTAVWLVHHYYYGENGYLALSQLRQELDEQTNQNLQKQHEIARLKADIQDLKTGLVATEEHARLTLGLIKPNEIFVQVLDVPSNPSAIPTPTNTQEALEVAGVEPDP